MAPKDLEPLIMSKHVRNKNYNGKKSRIQPIKPWNEAHG